ncbi:MAG: hypothetical protein LQ338_007783 [Usnochroma carphineum]|nr:MAG: hypothetical protein LQ338_007783 [Usnochroma carphineum]
MNRSSNVHPAEIDAMLHDVSNQMARSQLFRRLSANSNNSSPSSRRGNPRVVKAQGAGGSPHGVQRRKTTAAHTARNKSQTTKSFPSSQQLPQAATARPRKAKQQGLSSAARPMTWHPGTYPLENCQQELPYDGSMAFNPSTASQESTFIDYLNHPLYSSLDSTLPLETAPQGAPYNPSSQASSSNYAPDLDNYASLYQPTPYDYSTQDFYPDTADLYNYDQFASDFRNINPSQIPPNYASSFLLSNPCNFTSAYVRSSSPPPITKKPSKELVGMGLYDGPGRKELSTLNSSPDHIDQMFTTPQGKGLKLEETWQPPNEDVDDVEEEGSSEDEAEEVPQPVSTQPDVQSTFIPAYGDLSNQSFFFDGDDPYTDYLPFEQGLQVYRPKASDSGLQNFMWF